MTNFNEWLDTFVEEKNNSGQAGGSAARTNS